MSMRTRVLLAACLSAVTGFVALPAVAAEGKPNLGGVWLVEKPQAELKTTAGKAPPFKPEAARVYAKRKQAKASGGKSADDPDPAAALCLPHGVPRLLNEAQPIQILQKPKQVTVLYQANHQSRQFYIDDPIPAADSLPDPNYDGYSSAKWDGNALVVSTYSLNALTWMDDVGMPHGEKLTVVERYELAGTDTLRVKLTLTDPETFTAPWDAQLTYKRQPNLRLKEDACAEKLWHPPSSASGSG
ncbi:MAG: hypothetical protein WDO68_08440 [Gammaproteobacteria bacterium]